MECLPGQMEESTPETGRRESSQARGNIKVVMERSRQEFGKMEEE